VHTNAQASDDAAARGAVAYTTGTDIVFADRRYAPERADGRHLLAHELAHVVQQSSLPDAGATPRWTVPSADATEREAQCAARAVIDGGKPNVPTRLTGGAVVQRQPAPTKPTPKAPAPPTAPAKPPAPAKTPAPGPPASMSVDPLGPPTLGTCGKFDWKVNFNLPTKSPAGGYFVQDIGMHIDGDQCSDETAVAGCDGNVNFWEAWHVAAGGTQDEKVAAGTETFTDDYGWETCGKGTKGAFTVIGWVKFFEGLTLPASFKVNNPTTLARELPSTDEDPDLKGGTPAQHHSIKGRWNCCPAPAPAPAPTPGRRPGSKPTPPPAPAPAPERATEITSREPS
ncbi:MAG TPA: DUF4157 domain-containing protein, partial [Solirubrobacteraceae bacterium]